MLHLLLEYAYPLMIPLSLVEGPLVALAGGAGAASGRINPFIVYAIVMGGGLFQDVVYYWLGRWAISSDKVRRFAERVGAVRKTLDPLEAAWRHRMFATLAASKFAYGLYAPILVSAGMAKAAFWPFLGESLALSAVVLAGWLGLGFALGSSYGALGAAANWIMGGLGLAAVLALFLIARYARKTLKVRKPDPTAERSSRPSRPA
jgi:membrane protein DedA with SNARE-associated domain